MRRTCGPASRSARRCGSASRPAKSSSRSASTLHRAGACRKSLAGTRRPGCPASVQRRRRYPNSGEIWLHDRGRVDRRPAARWTWIRVARLRGLGILGELVAGQRRPTPSRTLRAAFRRRETETSQLAGRSRSLVASAHAERTSARRIAAAAGAAHLSPARADRAPRRRGPDILRRLRSGIGRRSRGDEELGWSAAGPARGGSRRRGGGPAGRGRPRGEPPRTFSSTATPRPWRAGSCG